MLFVCQYLLIFRSRSEHHSRWTCLERDFRCGFWGGWARTHFQDDDFATLPSSHEQPSFPPSSPHLHYTMDTSLPQFEENAGDWLSRLDAFVSENAGEFA
jgi:hypothetical protein